MRVGKVFGPLHRKNFYFAATDYLLSFLVNSYHQNIHDHNQSRDE